MALPVLYNSYLEPCLDPREWIEGNYFDAVGSNLDYWNVDLVLREEPSPGIVICLVSL